MNSDNLSSAIMIGVTTLVAVITISAIIIFYNSSLDVVRSTGSGTNFSTVYRTDIESAFLLSDTGSYIKGSTVANILSYYEQDINVTMVVQNIKYIDSNGNVAILASVTIDSTDTSVRSSAYNQALRYLTDNQDFTISVQETNSDTGAMIITMEGV